MSRFLIAAAYASAMLTAATAPVFVDGDPQRAERAIVETIRDNVHERAL